MTESFSKAKDGNEILLYTIKGGGLIAKLMPLGATLVRLYVPDSTGALADVVLGYDDADTYLSDWMNIGATVGRCANRIKGGTFTLNGQTVTLARNNLGNSLHSGPDFYSHRLWQVESQEENTITFRLDSPDGDQGYPGNVTIRVTYTLVDPGTLRINYEAVSDRDTVINLTNHSGFNLAGHQFPEKAIHQELTIFSSHFLPTDETFIPTGEVWDVTGTPMDFRTPKLISRDIETDYPQIIRPTGYDSTYLVEQPLCARLRDPNSGRTMEVYTNLPGVHFYSGNYLGISGKDSVYYSNRSGICLETQFYPDAIHHPQWPQPICRAGTPMCSQTCFVFSCDNA